ncbi:MAG: Uma2 family endonuclease [Spirulinaceae cyanobacterium]
MLTLKLDPVIQLTGEQFYQLCLTNPDLKLERNAQGELIMMPPTGGSTGQVNFNWAAQLWLWNDRTQLGVGFDSSTGFTLPNGAVRSPDIAWVERSRWENLAVEQRRRFPPLAPDFVLELMSPTDVWQETQQKMREYANNGVRLGWLIDLDHQRAEVYTPGQAVQQVRLPAQLSGGNVLPGFQLAVG